VGLTWTATGDDTTSGTAARYELRRSTAPIDAANFAAATPVPAGAPLLGGSAESVQAGDLACGTTYHFAVRAIDDFGNPGSLSNVVTVTTLGAPVLSVEPGAIEQTLSPGTAIDRTLTVTNAGLGRLDFEQPAAAESWLSAPHVAGRIIAGGATPLTLHLDATSLAPGTYSATLTYNSNAPSAPTGTVPVTLTVAAPAAVDARLPAAFGLRLASSNPAARGHALALSLPSAGPAEVVVFDVRGARQRTLAAGVLPAGDHVLRWDGADEAGSRVGPGVYFARARTAGGDFRLRVVVLE
jgi:hypothetical protein